MKQLLHNDGNHVIVGLNDTATYYNGNGKSNDTCTSAIIFELKPTLSEKSFAKSSNRCETDGDENNDDDNPITENSGLKDSNACKPLPAIDPNEIQAVAVTHDNSITWCAVARNDKSLSIYRIDETSSEDCKNRSFEDDIGANVILNFIYPHTVHKTSKRVSSLSFATVFGETRNHDNITVIVAGDLAGDANAYTLKDIQETEKEKIDDQNQYLDDEIVTKRRRLLLGHTASMLTSVHIVDNDTDDDQYTRHQRILTSDRDEKIRVSLFPSSYCIECFLLGHTAFVSSVAVSQETKRCVSVGGDYTIRLWDYTTGSELAVASTAVVSDEYDSSVSSATVDSIPSKVAMTADCSFIVTMCDECIYLDIWIIHCNTSDTEQKQYDLERCHRFKCPTQPLAISFLDNKTLAVVLREPFYIQQFIISYADIASSDETDYVNVTEWKNEFCAAVTKFATKRNIKQPHALLEKDERGCLKMGKMNEIRSSIATQPWNDASRKETNAERIKRLRKRRRDELQRQKIASDKNNTDNQETC